MPIPWRVQMLQCCRHVDLSQQAHADSAAWNAVKHTLQAWKRWKEQHQQHSMKQGLDSRNPLPRPRRSSAHELVDASRHLRLSMESSAHSSTHESVSCRLLSICTSGTSSGAYTRPRCLDRALDSVLSSLSNIIRKSIEMRYVLHPDTIGMAGKTFAQVQTLNCCRMWPTQIIRLQSMCQSNDSQQTLSASTYSSPWKFSNLRSVQLCMQTAVEAVQES